MNKVYIVTEGDYSDHCIKAVYSTHNRAELHTIFFGGDIEEWDIDALDTEFGAELLPFKVIFEKDGTILEIRQTSDWFDIGYAKQPQIIYRERMFIAMWAKDESHAKAIAIETRTKYLADKSGLTE